MSIFDLRKAIEQATPWWVPFAILLAIVVAWGLCRIREMMK